ncbi:hypothetical protein BpHYR1_034758 [Brachionus plicatilis]|uniref:Uncharacterized protein n=1 Tax=Brachionus plicatilis TaxID=10195 RepID=A0A3M7PFC4_BRAPC|nr:hypothetical protein BpHYR1_034758 [Brachionus plicatilis]
MKQPLFHLLRKSAKYVQINCCNFAEFAHILQTCAVDDINVTKSWSGNLNPDLDFNFIDFRLTVAKFLISSSEAPIDASPISCENWAKFGSASKGT